MVEKNSKVNLKAFSVIYLSDTTSLEVKYRGVVIDKISAEIEGLPHSTIHEDEVERLTGNTVEHYVKQHGKFIYNAIKEGAIPNSLLDRAAQLERTEGKEGGLSLPQTIKNNWNSPVTWESSACFQTPGVIVTIKTKSFLEDFLN